MSNNLLEGLIDLNKVKIKIKRVYFLDKFRKISFNFVIVILLILVISVFTSTYLVNVSNSKLEAESLIVGLGHNYDDIIAYNTEIAKNTPVSIDTIKINTESGDPRVLAIFLFLKKYNSPMATMSVAEAFVIHADENKFGQQWPILVAISGVESGFGRLIPRYGNISSYNAWGWAGGSKYGRWSYFDSWEHAIEVVSNGLAKGYSGTGYKPEVMVRFYCPDCYEDNKGTKWVGGVNGYINEIRQIHKQLTS
ncbi:MAG: hypothetical protein N3A71_00240 [Candidatus Dojkabacteria bacterium]|nr:hypothetical protein [Candidatus Dojkabacteria bacterium]